MIKKKSDHQEDIEIDNDDIIVEEDNILEQVAKLKAKLKDCQIKNKEYLNGWQRSKADFVNAQKENEKKAQQIASLTTEDVLVNILPVVDSFEMAFSNKEKWQEVDENWRVGVEYIYSQLSSTLKDYGLEEIDNKETVFNPEIHSILEAVETNKEEEDSLVEIVQKGYKIKDKVVRLAKVKVKKFNNNN